MAPPKKVEVPEIVAAYKAAVAEGYADTIQAREMAGGGRRSALSVTAERLGLYRETAGRRLRAALRAPSTPPPTGQEPAEVGASSLGVAPLSSRPKVRVKAGSEERIEPAHILEVRREREKASSASAKARALEDLVASQAREIESLRLLKKAVVPEIAWPAAPAIRGRHRLLPMLFTSDFQAGEVIRPDDLEGMNEFNSDILAQRYQLMIDKTIMLATKYVGAADFPGIYYLRGGDVISGEIHADLAETNDLAAIPAIRKVYQLERAGIRRLKARFGRVRVISVDGNHDRITDKPRSKGNRFSIGRFLSWWLESAFEDDPNVEFVTPSSPDVLFEAEGWPVLMSHGDRMGSKGGGGFIGPEATIIRGHHKLFADWSAAGHPPRLILTGHFHTSLRTVRGFANGSIAGYSEFARDLRAIADAARQWLIFMHERERVSNAFDLRLSPFPVRNVSQIAA